MASNQITLKLTVAWWLRYYIYGVVLMCWMTGCEPRADRLGYWVAKSVRVRHERSSAELAHR